MGCCHSGGPVAGGAAGEEVKLEDVQIQEGQGSKQEDSDWVRLGGTELEEALTKEWVKLIRADWLISHAEKGGVLARRQDLPHEAYVGLDELKEAGPGALGKGEWLRVIVLSYPWLQPGHPDPHGENLRHIAQVLKHFVKDSTGYSNGGKPYGVLIDFTALFQAPRTQQEHEGFLCALPALNVFYSHPQTVVLKVTEFPRGYPSNPSFHYDLPEGANTVTYSERGWCFAESAMSGLVKSSNKVLDVGRYSGLSQSPLWQVIRECKAGRNPPWRPDDFKEALDKKTFTSKKADFEKVAQLYSAAFERRLGGATELDYHQLGWGADAAQQLARALQNSRLLQTLTLSSNDIGDQGAVAVVEALLRNNTPLQVLSLHHAGIGQQCAVVLGQALQSSSALHTLNLAENSIGAEGAAVLAEALQGNRSLQTMDMRSNGIGRQGGFALGQALQRNGALHTLRLGGNGFGAEGAAALGEALQRNSSLQRLHLESNDVGDGGAAALGQALQINRTLQSLNLQQNGIGDQGAVALGRALQSNGSLQTLILKSNRLGDRGAAALGEALQSCTSLQTLNLEDNGIGHDGGMAWAQALQGSSALQSLNLASNLIGLEAKAALEQATRARSIPVQLRLG